MTCVNRFKKSLNRLLSGFLFIPNEQILICTGIKISQAIKINNYLQ